MKSSDQSALEALNKIRNLEGKQLKTTFQNKGFNISISNSNDLYVIIQSTGKSRHIDIKKEIIPAYSYLIEGNIIEGVGSGKKSIRGLGFSVANPSYVWAILSNFDNIKIENNKLSIKIYK